METRFGLWNFIAMLLASVKMLYTHLCNQCLSSCANIHNRLTKRALPLSAFGTSERVMQSLQLFKEKENSTFSLHWLSSLYMFSSETRWHTRVCVCKKRKGSFTGFCHSLLYFRHLWFRFPSFFDLFFYFLITFTSPDIAYSEHSISWEWDCATYHLRFCVGGGVLRRNLMFTRWFRIQC